MQIGNTSIGDGVYFIAEAGVNHNGDLDRALRMVEVAAESGVDAVKFQTFSTDRLVAKAAPKADYQETEAESQYDMLEEFELSSESHEKIMSLCRDLNVTFLSTPFDEESLQLLDDLDVPAIKVGSGELTNIPFLRQIAEIGRPIILSTGMGNMDEVDAAYQCIMDVEDPPSLSMLHCVSAYPTKITDVNLRAMKSMIERFDVPIGFSDHTEQIETPAIAVGAGATIVEKHFTLDATLPGPDQKMSIEPNELEKCVHTTRNAALALGHAEKRPTKEEQKNIPVVRRSLHVTRTLEPGDVLSKDDLVILRPMEGIAPNRLQDVIGQVVTERVNKGAPLRDSAINEH